MILSRRWRQNITEELSINLKPIYQETQDDFALLDLIKIAEKDIQNGDFEPSEKVFFDLRKKILIGLTQIKNGETVPEEKMMKKIKNYAGL